MDTYRSVRDHYQAAIVDQAALLDRVASIVAEIPPPLDARSLAPLDQFHFGGLAATAGLARRVGPTARTRVLDAGSGLGGPARYLAETFGCRVRGVDLAPDYVAVCRLLNELAGFAERVSVEVGNVTSLPFDAESFNLVWSQHVSMNIANRAQMYAEVRRVLAPSGRYAVFDPVLADEDATVIYPVPWAADSAASTLMTRADTEAAWRAAGLRPLLWEDVTEEALAWAAAPKPPAAGAEIGLKLVVGARMAELGANYTRNLRENRLRVAMAIGVCD